MQQEVTSGAKQAKRAGGGSKRRKIMSVVGCVINVLMEGKEERKEQEIEQVGVC